MRFLCAEIILWHRNPRVSSNFYCNWTLFTLLSVLSLQQTIQSLLQLRVHRLAVTTNSIANTVLCVLSQHRVLAFILSALKVGKEL